MKNSYIIAIVSLLLALTISVFGANAALAASTQTVAEHVAAIQAKGDTDIQNRVSSLQTLTTKVASAKKLTADQKSTLSAEINSEVTGLQTLKTTLAGEKTVATATADFKNVFEQHYIYAFYVPRVNRILAADAQNDAAANLIALIPKLQAYVTKAKDAGKDVTALQKALDEMKLKADDAQTQSSGVIATLTPLTASGYPANKTTVQTAGTTLKTSRSDLETARTDARTIVTGVRKLLGSVQ